jgi:hypothetical protein
MACASITCCGEKEANEVVKDIGESDGRAISVKADVTIEADV